MGINIAGPQSLAWDASKAQPGMYIYHLEVDGRLVSGIVRRI